MLTSSKIIQPCYNSTWQGLRVSKLVIRLSATHIASVYLPYTNKCGSALALCPTRVELKSFIFSSGLLSYITTHFFTYFSMVPFFSSVRSESCLDILYSNNKNIKSYVTILHYYRFSNVYFLPVLLLSVQV